MRGCACAQVQDKLADERYNFSTKTKAVLMKLEPEIVGKGAQIIDSGRTAAMVDGAVVTYDKR